MYLRGNRQNINLLNKLMEAKIIQTFTFKVYTACITLVASQSRSLLYHIYVLRIACIKWRANTLWAVKWCGIILLRNGNMLMMLVYLHPMNIWNLCKSYIKMQYDKLILFAQSDCLLYFFLRSISLWWRRKTVKR